MTTSDLLIDSMGDRNQHRIADVNVANDEMIKLMMVDVDDPPEVSLRSSDMAAKVPPERTKLDYDWFSWPHQIAAQTEYL